MITKRKYFSKITDVVSPPDLIEIQTQSYKWFLEEGLRELLEEISPIEDFIGKNLELHFLDYVIEEPKYDEKTVRERNLSYKASVRCKLRLVIKPTGEIKEQTVFLGDFPLMTKQGTFIINGVERVVVSQISRSPGVLFTSERVFQEELFGAKIIPNRGAWLEIETSSRGVITAKIDRKRKLPVTALLRAFGCSSNEELFKIFADVNTDPKKDFIKNTIEKDPATSEETGLMEFYRRVRPGDLVTVENARLLLFNMFQNFRRYDLSKVGRYKMNKRLGIETPIDREHRVLKKEDLIAVVREIIRLHNTPGSRADDIDHLKNRRVRSVGELVQNKVRVGLLRMERIVKDRMSVSDLATVTPAQLINVRPVVAVLQEFFASSQLSQFMDQTNPLSELEHKRRLSAMGPGGLSRERAGFDVRDVHSSHYGRICPIQTPEGPNIGLVGHMSCYTKINEYGFLETPYRWVMRKIQNKPELTRGRILREDLYDEKGRLIGKIDDRITAEMAAKIAKLPNDRIRIKPVVTDKIVYLDAEEEEKTVIAQANALLDEEGHFIEKRVACRNHGEPDVESVEKIDYMDVSPKQIVSIATALIPFVEHDDANRALMGSNMLRQAVSLIKPQAPLVGTGMEELTARNSGQMIIAEDDGEVLEATASRILVKEKKKGVKEYKLVNFVRSNQGTCINQRPLVVSGQKVKKDDILADGFSTDNGELALGQNILVAFMPWEGGNYEDAILISERLVQDDRYTSIHIEQFSVDVRETKLGPEIVTRDIPNVGDEALRNLDEDGIIRIGAEVTAGDILVGKITPKGETELTAEERLLRAIFGEKARDVKDVSLRLPHGEHGKVVGIKEFTREAGDELPTGVIKTIQVSVAQMRKISVGDKMAGRHGNKGVISKILPQEDMPYLADGTPVDIILNPLGVVTRMNIGQILETHLGWAAHALGYKVASPVFEGVSFDKIKEELVKAKLPESGKVVLFDGRTGEPFDRSITVGYIYMLKLSHLVEDKIHARSTGPYSLVSQQPLGGKAQFGGQRFGEMEVWALEAYGAAHTLQEILTIKSDDVLGRARAYESIIKGEDIKKPSTPESFNVLVKELQGLGLSVELLRGKEGEKIEVIKAEDLIEAEAEELARNEILQLGSQEIEVADVEALGSMEEGGAVEEMVEKEGSAEE